MCSSVQTAAVASSQPRVFIHAETQYIQQFSDKSHLLFAIALNPRRAFLGCQPSPPQGKTGQVVSPGW